jgi:hypothetical protein
MVFVTAKPQLGLVAGLWWCVEAYRTRGLKGLAITIAPFAVITAISLLAYGWWPLRMLRAQSLLTEPQNASLWPTSVPVGLALLAASLRRRDMRFAIPATACLSPHLTFQSWVVWVLPLVSYEVELLAAVAGLWVLIGIRALSI